MVIEWSGSVRRSFVQFVFAWNTVSDNAVVALSWWFCVLLCQKKNHAFLQSNRAQSVTFFHRIPFSKKVTFLWFCTFCLQKWDKNEASGLLFSMGATMWFEQGPIQEMDAVGLQFFDFWKVIDSFNSWFHLVSSRVERKNARTNWTQKRDLFGSFEWIERTNVA